MVVAASATSARVRGWEMKRCGGGVGEGGAGAADGFAVLRMATYGNGGWGGGGGGGVRGLSEGGDGDSGDVECKSLLKFYVGLARGVKESGTNLAWEGVCREKQGR